MLTSGTSFKIPSAILWRKEGRSRCLTKWQSSWIWTIFCECWWGEYSLWYFAYQYPTQLTSFH